MLLNDFDFTLPENLIAQHPPKTRGNSRLLIAPQYPIIEDSHFLKIIDFLNPGDVLVINNTQVIKARLFGQKITGGKIEALIERVINHKEAWAHLKASKAPKAGTIIIFDHGIQAEVVSRQDDLFLLTFHHEKNVWQILEQIGHMPLPPYIEREAASQDDSRYQTVYAQERGAVAAPTAGLHFTEDTLQQIKQKGVHIAHVTLHVGAGTFQPIRVQNINEHIMHSEWFEVSQDTVDIIQNAHNNHHQVIAVGTTSMRALESAARSDKLISGCGDTDIFIKPGYQFKVVDKLITNFHLPKSTLLMLVSAFAGTEYIQKIYQYAITKQYRFFSYGDAMLLTRQNN